MCIKQESGEGLIYSNKVTNTVPEPSSLQLAISRTFTFDIPISCHVFDRGLGSLNWQANSHYNHTLNGNKTLGEAEFNLQMYHDKKYNDTFDPDDFPVEVNVAETLYLEASVSSALNVTVALDTCVATRTKTPVDRDNFTFIQEG